jgi:hypothetical protein
MMVPGPERPRKILVIDIPGAIPFEVPMLQFTAHRTDAGYQFGSCDKISLKTGIVGSLCRAEANTALRRKLGLDQLECLPKKRGT